MTEGKRAAFDELADRPLEEVTAAEFLEALESGGVSARDLAVWPEKKKVELTVEPENFGGVRIKDLIPVLRNEKKKLERELPPFLGEKKKVELEPQPQPQPFLPEKKKVELELPQIPNLGEKKKVELEPQPGDIFSQPQPFTFEEVLVRLEERVMNNLRDKGVISEG
jgi:hypothetical protein